MIYFIFNVIDKFDDELFEKWMKDPHVYHSYYDYSGRHYYSS